MGLAQTRCTHCLQAFTPCAEIHCGFGPGLCDGPRPGPCDVLRHGPCYGKSAPLCSACSALFAPYAGPRCPRCGLPWASSSANEQRADAHSLCGHCLSQPPPWDGLAFHGLYKGALRDALLRLKFGGELSLAPLLGACLLEAARCLPRPDTLVAMPLHAAHLRSRGYNQAHELARALHRLSGLPLLPDLLSRPVPGPPQAVLSGAARRDNVRDSFRAAPAARGLRLWLLDDVMTTGSTLTAAVLALRAAGARRVDVLLAARTPQDH